MVTHHRHPAGIVQSPPEASPREGTQPRAAWLSGDSLTPPCRPVRHASRCCILRQCPPREVPSALLVPRIEGGLFWPPRDAPLGCETCPSGQSIFMRESPVEGPVSATRHGAKGVAGDEGRSRVSGATAASNPPAAPPGSDLFSAREWKAIAAKLRLSAREVQIVRSIFDDVTDSTIATDLGISVHTVHTHCRRLYRKLGTTSRVEVVLRIVREHFRLTAGRQSRQP
ncbi:MAG: helix-turn-helix transcriptional regulator [Akkermansiaceae bacterium]|nr:helix-turn-helix transcriptional regulator [Akkermansiaceae bacterium]